jgi:S-adenosylmethionine decarboxylase proenzyme
MIWLHIISDLKWVDFSKIDLNKNILENLISDLLKKYNLSELWSYYHTFNKDNEITCVVALAESHISIHTWPEKKYISLDIFVCNLWEDNSLKAKKIYQELKDFFKPENIEENLIDRKSS